MGIRFVCEYQSFCFCTLFVESFHFLLPAFVFNYFVNVLYFCTTSWYCLLSYFHHVDDFIYHPLLFFPVKFSFECSHLLMLLNFLFEFSFLCVVYLHLHLTMSVYITLQFGSFRCLSYCNLNAALVFFNFHSFISCKNGFLHLLMNGMGEFYGYIFI